MSIMNHPADFFVRNIPISKKLKTVSSIIVTYLFHVYRTERKLLHNVQYSLTQVSLTTDGAPGKNEKEPKMPGFFFQ